MRRVNIPLRQVVANVAALCWWIKDLDDESKRRLELKDQREEKK